MKDVHLYIPKITGHELQWLKSLINKSRTAGVKFRIYTLVDEVDIKSLINQYASSVEISSFENEPELFGAWSHSIRDQKSIGIVWSADKLLFRLVKIKSYLRLVIMRPYLESLTLAGISRFIIKRVLICFLKNRKNVELVQLAIPFSRSGLSSKHWIKDDFNVNLFNEIDEIEEGDTKSIFFNFSESSKIISIAGFLAKRKNPQVLYEIFKGIQEGISDPTYLFLLGKQDEDWKMAMKDWDLTNVVAIDRYLSLVELEYFLEKSNLVVLPYSNRGASGVALNSIALGTPVLICGTRKWEKLEIASRNYLRRAPLNARKMTTIAIDQLKLKGSPKRELLTNESLKALSEFLLCGFDDEQIKVLRFLQRDSERGD